MGANMGRATSRPKVIRSAKLYCFSLFLFYGIAFFFLFFYVSFELPNSAVPIAFCSLLCAVFGATSAIATFAGRRPWAYWLTLSLIFLGLTSVCCLPFCIPLLVSWLKPETKKYYGVGDSRPS